MKQLIVLIASFFTVGMNAQDNPGKLRIGLHTGFEKNISSEGVVFDTHTGNSAEYDRVNYRLGLNVEYLLKKNISIFTAISYSNKDYTGTYYCIVCDFEFPPSPQHFKFRFIEVPITLKYYFLPDKVRLFTEAGLNNQYLLRKRVAADNSYFLGLKLGAGVEYNLNDTIAFQLAFDYYHTMSKIYEVSRFELNTYVIGIGVMKRL